MTDDVWFSIDTAAGMGGISAITCAGPALDLLLKKCFRPVRRRSRPADGLTLGHVLNGVDVIDEAMCARTADRDSLTGWPTATITCHGGIAVIRAATKALKRAGARRVQPSAWWRQAVRAGRRDRLQAAAAVLLPRATTALSAAILLAQREGAGREAMARIREHPEEAERILTEWRATYPLGRACVSPLRVALVGAPNAGKSTLLNTLVGRPRAVVHEEPGTTRDVVEEPGAIDGVPVIWIDTAGIGPPRGGLDARSQSAARAAARGADLLVVLIEQAALPMLVTQRDSKGLPFALSEATAVSAPSRRANGVMSPPFDSPANPSLRPSSGWRATRGRRARSGRTDSHDRGATHSASIIVSNAGPWGEFVQTALGTSTPPWIPVLSKCDLAPSGRAGAPAAATPLPISASNGEGLESLRRAVLDASGVRPAGQSFPPPGAPVCWAASQAARLDRCLKRLGSAANRSIVLTGLSPFPAST